MKLLADAQTSDLFVSSLRALGWDVETVHQHGRSNVKHDERLVAYARGIDRVFLSFDQFGAETSIRVAIELHEHGGKVLRIDGGPEQPPERALGRFLFHLPDWYPFLDRQDGLAHLSDLKNACLLFPRARIRAMVWRSGQAEFDAYLAKRRDAPAAARTRRPRKTPPDQTGMNLSSDM